MKQLILSLLLVSIFFSCSDKNETAPENNNGPVFVKEYESDYGTFKLTYDEQDRLSKAELWITNGYTPALYLYQIVEYTYTGSKLTGYSTRQGGENTPPGAPVTTNFVFDDKGYIKQSVTGNTVIAEWKTDAEGRPVARIISNGLSPEWEYTADGNLKLKYQSTSGTGWTRTGSGNLTYNTEYNPFFTNGTGLALYAAFGYVAGGPNHLITKNLISASLMESVQVSENPPPGGTTTKSSTNSTYTYTKDANGLLASKVLDTKLEEFLNGTKTKTDIDTYTYKFTCFRK